MVQIKGDQRLSFVTVLLRKKKGAERCTPKASYHVGKAGCVAVKSETKSKAEYNVGTTCAF